MKTEKKKRWLVTWYCGEIHAIKLSTVHRTCIQKMRKTEKTSTVKLALITVVLTLNNKITYLNVLYN